MRGVARNVYLNHLAVEEMQPKQQRKTDCVSPKRCSFAEENERRVVSECAICLSSYEEGNSVVASSNPSCVHIFHSKCIEEWLICQRVSSLVDDVLRCPCCRQRFLLLEKEKEKGGGGGGGDLKQGTAPVLETDSV
jgi:hypothetical protein